MIPKSLSISGFLSYREPVDIDFSTFQVACITGANGSGKSSILDAITWSLFGQARKRDDSIINSFSETAAVDFHFIYENIEYRVRRSKIRGKSTILEFQILTPDNSWKPLSERSMRKTEERITETLRLDYETFVNASFFLQGKADQFTQQRPGDRKRILSNILGLEIWEQYRLKSAEQRKLHEKQITSIDGRLTEINAELAEEDARSSDLKDLNTQLADIEKTRKASENTLNTARKQHTALVEQQKALADLQVRLERKEKDLEVSRNTGIERKREQQAAETITAAADQISDQFKQLQKIREDIREGLQQSEEYHAISSKIQEQEGLIRAEKARMETELGALGISEKQAASTAQKLTASDKELDTADQKLAVLQKMVEEKESISQKLQQKNARLGEFKAQNSQLKLEMDDLKSRIDQLQTTSGANCPVCGQPLSDADREKLLAELKDEGTEKGDLWRQNKIDFGTASSEISALEKKTIELKNIDAELLELTTARQSLISDKEQMVKVQQDWMENGAPRKKEINTLIEKEQFAPEARKNIQTLQAELAGLAYDQDKFKLLQQQEAELGTADEKMKELEKAQAALKPLLREIEALETQITQNEQELAADRDRFETQAAALAVQLTELGDVVEMEKDFFALKERESAVIRMVGAAQQRVNVLDELRKRKTILNADRESEARKVGQYKSLEAAFGRNGVPAMLIEQALPQIETAANEILGRLSNDSMFISFVTQEKYKDKKREDMRETLEIQIQDGAGVRDYEMYSGGEAFKINFAVRMALSEVLAQRAGARLQTLVIDEGFGSQDEQGRQRLIEAINIIKADFEKILVITHIDALKDAFDNQVQVVKTERGSVVEVI